MTPTSVLEDYLNAQTVEEVWDLHTRNMEHYGFDRLIYGYTRYRTATSLGDPEDFVLLTNHSTDYIDVFLGQEQYFNGPMVRWALENEGACSWSIVGEMERSGLLSDKELKMVEFNRKMGVTAGYTISFKSASHRSKGGMALTAHAGLTQTDVDEIWKEQGDDILVLNNLAHLKVLSLPYTPPSRALTKRQREVLGWVGDGKTVQDIALLMELTPATVEKHLRLAREALSVETTAQAVLKAAFQNQIYVFDAEI